MTLILKFDLTFAVTDKKNKSSKGKRNTKQISFLCTFLSKEGLIMILYHNSALCYFGRNTTSIAFNSNWYNLDSMLLCSVIWKPLYAWCLLTDISLYWLRISKSIFFLLVTVFFRLLVTSIIVFSYEKKIIINLFSNKM